MNLFEFFNIESEFEVARIPVTNDMKQVARVYSDKIEDLDKIKRTRNYTLLQTVDRYYWGALGELAFHKFLDQNEISHKWTLVADGKADKGDFVINGKVFDVKTSSVDYSDRLLVSIAQYNLHHADFYVAVKIWEDCAYIIGIASRKSFRGNNVCEFYPGVKDYYVLYDRIRKKKKERVE